MSGAGSEESRPARCQVAATGAGGEARGSEGPADVLAAPLAGLQEGALGTGRPRERGEGCGLRHLEVLSSCGRSTHPGVDGLGRAGPGRGSEEREESPAS